MQMSEHALSEDAMKFSEKQSDSEHSDSDEYTSMQGKELLYLNQKKHYLRQIRQDNIKKFRQQYPEF